MNGMRERLLTVEELADLLQVPVRSVYVWRQKGIGPRGIRVGKYVRYRPSEVNRWLEAQAEEGRRA